MIKDECHCQHDRTSHYRDIGAASPHYGSCLCRGCECKEYVHFLEPKPEPKHVVRRSLYPWEDEPWCGMAVQEFPAVSPSDSEIDVSESDIETVPYIPVLWDEPDEDDIPTLPAIPAAVQEGDGN